MNKLKSKAIVISTGCLIASIFVGSGTFIHKQYLGWKADQQILNTRMTMLEEQQRENAEQVQVIAEATSSQLRDIKSILTQNTKKVKYSAKDVQCMAKNIYHEAGVESFKGKIAVGQVTLNRLATKRWGETICDVVYAKAQFSWTLSQKKKLEKPEGELWEESKRATYRVLKGERLKALTTSLYYHTDYIVAPKWADRKAKLTQIDQHIFYKQAKLTLSKKCESTKTKKCTVERRTQRV